MMFLPPKSKVLLSIITTFFLTLTLPISATANMADWGRVQQFEKKNKLANQGNIQAMYDLGRLYERGRGTNVNLAKASKWYQTAADAGNSSAQARLGILYFEGRGVKQNYNKALKLLNSASKDNIPSALFQLANMYELGTGVRQNLHKSIAWYKKAQQYGYYLAEGKISRLQQLAITGAKINNKATPKTVIKTKIASAPLIQIILKGHWLKRKSAVGYLPSNITNCSKNSYNSMICISTSQERSTGSEIITYNTESTISVNNSKSFNITYMNNVLEVTQLEVENGDGELIAQAPSRIKKGKRGKKRILKCRLITNKTMECSKGASTFNLVSR